MSPKIGYLELPVTDPHRAAEFFGTVFGWQPVFRNWSEGTHVVLEGAGGEIGCALAPTGGAGIDAPTPVVHVRLSELDGFLMKVGRAGGEVVAQARRVDDLGSFARFRDTEGNLWGLWAAADEPPQG